MSPATTQTQVQRVQEAYPGCSSRGDGREMASGMLCLRGESLDCAVADVRNVETALQTVYSFPETAKPFVPSATVPWWGVSMHAGHQVIAFRKGLVRIRLFFYPSLWVYLDQLASLLSARWTSRLVTCPTPKCVASRQQVQPIIRANILIYYLTLESTRIGRSKID